MHFGLVVKCTDLTALCNPELVTYPLHALAHLFVKQGNMSISKGGSET